MTTVLVAERRGSILFASCTALMAVVSSASGLNVAQQALAVDLNASQTSVLLIINAYLVTLAALLLPMGAISDRWGRKPVLVAGLLIFGISSAAAGFVDTVGLMVAARAVAGVGAAMVMPVTLSVITSSFPASERAQAIGIWTAVAGGGGLLGMLASALLVDFASWRWLFALPAALVALAFMVTLRSVPNSRQRFDRSFDIVGAVLSVTSVGGLVLGIYVGLEQGWAAASTITSLVGSAFAVVGFTAYELHRAEPLLDLRAFRDHRLASGSTTLLVIFAVSAGVFVVLFPFFEAVLGWSAIRSMLGLLPLIVAMMGTSGLAAKLSKRIGSRQTMLLGVGATTAGLVLMAAFVSVNGGYRSILAGMVVVGVGMGLAMPPSTEAITSSLSADEQGVASALNDTTREVGSALGVAILGAVLTAIYRRSITPHLDSVPTQVAAAAKGGIGRAFERAGQEHGQAEAKLLRAAARHAFVRGWAASMWVGAAIMVALFLFLALRAAPQATTYENELA